MTSVLFADWLKKFNLKMHGRSVLLLIDNAPSHVSLSLSNVRVEFLPPNTTAFLQPMDAGIICNFKLKYKTHFVRWIVDQLDEQDGQEEVQPIKQIDLLTAINKLVVAWNEVSANTIRNCWAHTGIVSAPMVAQLKQENEPKRQVDYSPLDNLIAKLSLNDPMPAVDYVSCDNDNEDTQCTANDGDGEGSMGDGHAEEDEDENRPLSHRDALQACHQLMTYVFAHNLDCTGLNSLISESRKCMVGSMKQKSITSYFQ